MMLHYFATVWWPENIASNGGREWLLDALPGLYSDYARGRQMAECWYAPEKRYIYVDGMRLAKQVLEYINDFDRQREAVQGDDGAALSGRVPDDHALVDAGGAPDYEFFQPVSGY